MDKVAIAWQVGLLSGWGVLGTNLAVQMGLRGIRPVLLSAGDPLGGDPLQRRALERAVADAAPVVERCAQGERLPFPMLHGLADRLGFPDYWGRVGGSPDVGFVFFEHVDIPAEAIEQARRLPLIIAGSGWNARVLADLGLTNVALCPQGVDPAHFHPAPRTGHFRDRFVVFSGGKLEYRKGQDIVIGAFRIFRQRHPDALLMTAWHNPWLASVATLNRSPHVEGLPRPLADGLAIEEWLATNGLPPGSVVDLGAVPNSAVAPMLREADIAVFPNRCEGGTNLVAMECMACGVPVVLSRNTGHLDLIEAVGDDCFVLEQQFDLGELSGLPAMAGWGESMVDELVARLEEAYADRALARRRGAVAAAAMRDWSWELRVGGMLDAIAKVT
ncbi:MAG: glycosyltransferase family 4 protein [Alphaproteobacteria bacterium]|nr:glycosyltransferase family 4 protein [Alphaproteobacteria bacterium]